MLLSALSVYSTSASVATNVPDGGHCGPNYGGAVCGSNLCCSIYGYCGNTQVHCQTSCASQCQWPLTSSTTTATATATPTVSGNGGRCGPNSGAVCGSNLCCSTYGYCGNTQVHCQTSCASQCQWPLTSSTTSSAPSSTTASGISTSAATATATTWAHQNDPFTNCLEHKTVAIAFDDGPDNTTASITNTVLEVLGFSNVSIPAMFFEIGEKVAQNPQIAVKVANAGYVIGDHTWNHISSTLLTSPEVNSEATQAAAEIISVTGKAPRYLRPPYGDYNTQAMQVWNSLGYFVITWSIDTRDWVVGSTPASALQRVKDVLAADSTSGHIMLCHDIHTPCRDALPDIVALFKSYGYKFVSMEECTGIKPYR